MNTRYFYKNAIAAFLRQSEDEIFGMLSMNDEYDTMATQKFAWLDEIRLLKSTLQSYANEEGWVVFEYTIPRLGKRIDVVVLLRERVFILEFKAGEVTFNRQDVDQVMDYALDLKNFHQGSANRMIVPILVATESPSYSTTVMTSHYDDGIYEPMMTNAKGLTRVFELVLQQEVEMHHEAVSLADWVKSRYAPTPTIIEAASALYSRHSVEEITRHEAEGEQLDRTTDYVLKVRRQEHLLCHRSARRRKNVGRAKRSHQAVRSRSWRESRFGSLSVRQRPLGTGVDRSVGTRQETSKKRTGRKIQYY